MYLGLAWLVYLLAASLALHKYSGGDWFLTVLAAFVGGALLVTFGGGLGLYLASRTQPPDEARSGMAAAILTLTLTAFLYWLAPGR